MDCKPRNWHEILQTPEFDGNGKVKERAYFHSKRTDREELLSFVVVLYKVEVDGRLKWYISNSTASCLAAAGYREKCETPIHPITQSIVYDLKTSKLYADWYLCQGGILNTQLGTRTTCQILLLFFVNDKNWAPFHMDYIAHPDINVTVKKRVRFNAKRITNRVFGVSDFSQLRTIECYTKEEIEFIRVLIALASIKGMKFIEESCSGKIASTLNHFNLFMGYNIDTMNFFSKVDLDQFIKLSSLETPILFQTIYRYFLSINSNVARFVRVDLTTFVEKSAFNKIFRFLCATNKKTEHCTGQILLEFDLYFNTFKDKLEELGNLIPYAELFITDYEWNLDLWKNLLITANSFDYRNTVDIATHAKYTTFQEFCRPLQHFSFFPWLQVLDFDGLDDPDDSDVPDNSDDPDNS